MNNLRATTSGCGGKGISELEIMSSISSLRIKRKLYNSSNQLLYNLSNQLKTRKIFFIRLASYVIYISLTLQWQLVITNSSSF